MRSSTFYPAKAVSGLLLLLLSVLNALGALAQDSPNITPPAGGTCMPYDPNAVSPVYTYTYTGGGANPVWSVRGEIAIVSASGNTVRIKPTGFGKGRLYVTYDQTPPCDAKREHIDVFKTFELADNIVGPRCVTPIERVTYSIRSVLSKNINQEIGIDSYKWHFPAEWEGRYEYVAGDQSSITVDMPPTIVPYTLSVEVGKCNPKLYTIHINPKLEAPVITTSHTGCLSVTDTELTLGVQGYNSANTALKYTWLLPSNSSWRFKPGYTENSVPTVVIVDNTTNFVRLMATRNNSLADCDNFTTEPFEIRRKLLPGGKITTSDTDKEDLIKITNGTACVDGSKPAAYRLVDAGDVLVSGSFTWKFTPDDATNTSFSFHSQQPGGPTGPTASFSAGSSGGTLTVSTKSSIGIPACDVFSLPIKLMPTRPAGIMGLDCQAANAVNQVYQVTSPVAGTTYTWTLTGGLTSPDPLVGVGPSIRVNVGTAGGTIRVVASNGNCTSAPSLKTVGLMPVQASAINITSDACLNRAVHGTLEDLITFTVANPVPGQTYNWSVVYPTYATAPSPGPVWTVRTGSATNGGPSITYATNGAGGGPGNNFQVRVTAVNDCGVSPATTLENIPMLGPGNINVTPSPISDGTSDIGETNTATLRTYPAPGSTTTTAITTGVTYEWFIDGVRVTSENPAHVFIGGPGGNALSLYGNSPGTVRVIATRNGCRTSFERPSNFANFSASRVGSNETMWASNLVTVYPNPSSGEFTLELNADGEEASVVLRDLQGKAVYKTRQREKKAKVSVSHLPNGMYFLQVTAGRKTVVKKIQIQK